MDLNEIKQILPKDLFDLAIDIFNITENGNFEDKNILYRTEPLNEYAKRKNISYVLLSQKLDKIKNFLYRERMNRISPLRDEKIITSWNGMMIEAFAHAGYLFNDKSLVLVAEKAANFIWNNNRNDENILLRSFYINRDSQYAAQEDYAYYINGLITLYDSTNNAIWLEKSLALTNKMLELFWDDTNGGFYLNYDKNNFLNLTRVKDRHDGAIVSSNAMAIIALNRLSKRTGNREYLAKAKQTIASFAAEINQIPNAFPGILLGRDEIVYGSLKNIGFVADGNIKIEVKPHENTNNHLNIMLSMRNNWHINSNLTSQTNVLPTVISIDERVKGWEIENLNYPSSELIDVKFQTEPLSVFSGDIVITGNINKTSSNDSWLRSIPLNIKLQACNDEICLLPEDITLYTQLH